MAANILATSATRATHPRITIFCDGLCEPNPGGHACWAFVAIDETGSTLAEEYGYLGHGAGQTNNRAEYAAVSAALDFAQDRGLRGACIKTDSKLVAYQLGGRWSCNSREIERFCLEAKQKGRALGARIGWVPREQNQLADELTRRAYREARQASRRERGAE